MEIVAVKISGYANIEAVEINLGKLNALVALNNYGKSNVLKAIDFGVDFITQPNSTKDQMMAYRPVIPINSFLESYPFSFEIQLNTRFLNEEYTILYGYSFEWIKTNKEKGQKVVSEYLKMRPLKVGSKYKIVLNRDSNKATYMSSTTSRCDKKLKIGERELAINKMLSYDDLFYWDILKELNSLSIATVDTLQNPNKIFRNIIIKEKLDDIVKNDYSVTLDEVENVAFFIYGLMKKRPLLYELLKDSVKTLLPNIEDFDPIEIDLKKNIRFSGEKTKLPLDFPEKFYDLRVKEINNNQQTSIDSLSSGSQKLFYVLALTIAAEVNKTPLVTFEELENSIHPGLLQKLLIIIDSLTKNTKVLLTSHSPYLIQYLDISTTKIGIPNAKGLADFREIKKSKFNRLISIAAQEGISIGDVIFDQMMESVGGESETLNELCK